MLAPLIMCVLVPLAMLVLAVVILAASDHAAPVSRHALGVGVPTRTIYQRLDWERKLDAQARRTLREWRIERANRDADLGIKLPTRQVRYA